MFKPPSLGPPEFPLKGAVLEDGAAGHRGDGGDGDVRPVQPVGGQEDPQGGQSKQQQQQQQQQQQHLRTSLTTYMCMYICTYIYIYMNNNNQQQRKITRTLKDSQGGRGHQQGPGRAGEDAVGRAPLRQGREDDHSNKYSYTDN